ncbi:MAG: CorA family divalent cation transporter [Planctomycetaceae bacterium]
MFFAVELDFETKEERLLKLNELSKSRDRSQFYWIDLSEDSLGSLDEVLSIFSVSISEPVKKQLERNISRVNETENWIHFRVADVSLDDHRLRLSPIDIYLGEGFLLTVHEHDSNVINGMQQSYSRNFRQVALSHGFLHFELVDHLTRCYTDILVKIAENTKTIETKLFGSTDDAIFGEVSSLMRAILEFSNTVVNAREVFHNLSSRLSPYIPQTTQPFLEKKAELLDRMRTDITTEREVLSESLTLYMGIVTHRTNHFVTRLTVISALFLPLHFLVGVYGMNFEYMPETDWPYGYIYFWGLVFFTVSILAYLMKRQKWL